MNMRFVFVGMVLFSGIAAAQDYDLVIRGGRIVDGTGRAAFAGDVALRDGKIAAVGVVPGKGREEIDAGGGVGDGGGGAQDLDRGERRQLVAALPRLEPVVHVQSYTYVIQLSTYVCMYVCMHVCMHACTYRTYKILPVFPR